eukprot:8727367-Karenia_brevis.AAC.1
MKADEFVSGLASSMHQGSRLEFDCIATQCGIPRLEWVGHTANTVTQTSTAQHVIEHSGGGS